MSVLPVELSSEDDDSLALTATRRAAGFLFFVLAAQFMVVMMLAASMAKGYDPGYDLVAGSISLFGMIPATALVFNLSLVVVGILNITGGLLYWRLHGKSWLLTTFVLAGLGAIGAGVLPMDVPKWHTFFAVVGFVCFNLQTIGCAADVDRPLRWIGWLLGFAGILWGALMALGDAGFSDMFWPFGRGAVERLIAYPPMIWLIAFGGRLMGES